MTAWLLHTLERRRKKQRYSEALQRHRKRLITIGVTQWIKVRIVCNTHIYIDVRKNVAKVPSSFRSFALSTERVGGLSVAGPEGNHSSRTPSKGTYQ